MLAYWFDLAQLGLCLIPSSTRLAEGKKGWRGQTFVYVCQGCDIH